MRKILIIAAACLAAVAVFILLTLPAPPTTAAGAVDGGLASRTIPGAYHVHSTVSDGTRSRDEIAAAAAAAGLRFVVFTDHGDGTRVPDLPRYASGVLCIDGVEISTNGGHYVALDMRPSQYPLGGEARAVVEDVRRLGGFGIAAHPYSAKASLRWTDWIAPVDGIEWLNADSEWRDESVRHLMRLPFDYLVRPAPALASILDRPVEAMARWDEIIARRPLVALGAHDAHGGIGAGLESDARLAVPGFPSYEASFRAFATRVITAAPLSGSPPGDARLVLDAIRRGRVFTAIDAVAAPAQLDYSATSGAFRAQMGDSLPFEEGVELVVRSTLPDGGSLVLVCDGQIAAESTTGELRQRPAGVTACRPEIRAPRAPGTPPVPWIAGNAIQLLAVVSEPVGLEPLYESSSVLSDADWVVEKDPDSQGTVARIGGGVALQYRLRGGARASQYVAAVAPVRPPLPPYDRIIFTVEAAGPMRVSVQLRFGGGERWVRSIYAEHDARRVILPIDEFVAADSQEPARPDFRQPTSILFVVDLVNAQPGAEGWLTITDLAFGRQVPR